MVEKKKAYKVVGRAYIVLEDGTKYERGDRIPAEHVEPWMVKNGWVK